jgi:hypothetical protein
MGRRDPLHLFATPERTISILQAEAQKQIR